MDLKRQMTRAEFLHAVVRSPVAKAGAYLVAAATIVGLASVIWQARVAVGIAASIVCACVVLSTATYLLSTRSRRVRLDREIELTRSHWSYAYRGLIWPGMGAASGGLIAFYWQGRDPTGDLIGGGLLAALGLLARIAWAYRKAAA